MKSDPTETTLNVRRFRERLRERGLVKKDVWILPEYAAQLSSMEKAMREPGNLGDHPVVHETTDAKSTPTWTIASLQKALSASPIVQAGVLTVDYIEGAEPSLRLVQTSPADGQVDMLLAVSGEQILVEAYLWPLSSVIDPVAFNECILQTHKYLPLSTFSLTEVGGVPGYTLFGSLSSHCPLSSILFEIQMLRENVVASRALYAEFLVGYQGVDHAL